MGQHVPPELVEHVSLSTYRHSEPSQGIRGVPPVAPRCRAFAFHSVRGFIHPARISTVGFHKHKPPGGFLLSDQCCNVHGAHEAGWLEWARMEVGQVQKFSCAIPWVPFRRQIYGQKTTVKQNVSSVQQRYRLGQSAGRDTYHNRAHRLLDRKDPNGLAALSKP